MNTPDSVSHIEPIVATVTQARKALRTDVLSNVNMAWKMVLMVSIVVLGAVGVALTGVQGLGLMRFHLSNIYDFMLIPIVAINQADTSLADIQLDLEALKRPALTTADQAAKIEAIQASESKVVEVMNRYDTEWVTTVSPEFTAVLRDLGRLDLQKDEAAALTALHATYDGYVSAREAYLASVQAGAPDDQLGSTAVNLLTRTRSELERLIEVNNKFAQLSNQAAVSAYQQAQINMGLAFAATLLLGLMVSYVITRSITQRVASLVEATSSLQRGNLAQSLIITGRDEIAKLGQAFNEMTIQLRDLIGSLEQRVTERTAELSQASESLRHRANQLQASAQVSRAATTLTDSEQLIPQVVELIQQRFDFYYAGLFLVDADNRYAVLQFGSGEAGRAMKERGHCLEVGGQSMVGWVCVNKQARIALDVGQDAVRFANPLLPDTHSEMALPLRTGERVIGVLDVQSAQVAAFDEGDVAVLQSMADQVTVALENARLFQQSRAALEELETTNRLLVREGWQGYLGPSQACRRAEFHEGIAPGAESPSEPLTVPLELRGQSLGRLTLRREGGRAWSSDEIEMIQAIALQTALSADNARLIEQTRQALDEARALYETSREITSAGGMSEVLSAVLDDLARTGIQAAAIALFDTPTREQAKYIELVGAWDYTGTPRLAPGVRFAIADFALFDRITNERTLVSADLVADPEIDEMARMVLGGLGLRGMAITPLAARGQWIGLLFALTEQPHTFTPAELNFHRALADQAAVAIDNRRLLAETQQRAQREALIRQITTRVRAASDIQGVLEATATELAQSMGVSRAIVRLTMGDDGGAE